MSAKITSTPMPDPPGSNSASTTRPPASSNSSLGPNPSRPSVILESTGPYPKAAVGALARRRLARRRQRPTGPRLRQGTRQARQDRRRRCRHLGAFRPGRRHHRAPPCCPRKSWNFAISVTAAANSSACSRPRRTTATPAQGRALESPQEHRQAQRFLRQQIEELEDRMDRIVAASETFRAKDEILQSVHQASGRKVSRTLLVHLPELGQEQPASIAAAGRPGPFADDSGTSKHPPHPRWSGPRCASRCTRRRWRHPLLHDHESLLRLAQGVARPARSRSWPSLGKLLVLANALLQAGPATSPGRSSVCLSA